MYLSDEILKIGPKYLQDMNLSVLACYFDIDNRLVSNDSPGLPSSEFCALARRHGGSIPIAVATARSLQRVIHILEAIDSKGISVLSNGAVIYDADKKTIIKDYCLPIRSTLEITKHFQDHNITYEIQDNGIDYTWVTNTTKLKNRKCVGNYNVAQDVLSPKGARECDREAAFEGVRECHRP